MKEIIRDLLPPDENGKPLSSLTRWRIAIFVTCVIFIVFISWALSPYGFARAGDMQNLRTSVDELRLSQIEQQIYDIKQSECVSTDRATRRYFSNRVMELARRYRQLSGSSVDIPPCVSGESTL